MDEEGDDDPLVNHQGQKEQSRDPGCQHASPPGRLQDHAGPSHGGLVCADHPEGRVVGRDAPTQRDLQKTIHELQCQDQRVQPHRGHNGRDPGPDQLAGRNLGFDDHDVQLEDELRSRLKKRVKESEHADITLLLVVSLIVDRVSTVHGCKAVGHDHKVPVEEEEDVEQEEECLIFTHRCTTPKKVE